MSRIRKDKIPAMTGDDIVAISPRCDRTSGAEPEMAIVNRLAAIELTTPNSKLLAILERREFW
jgi:hypothetical protein